MGPFAQDVKKQTAAERKAAKAAAKAAAVAAAAAVADPDETRTDRVPEEETFGGLSEDPVKSLVDGVREAGVVV